jgi:hypothetical protein
VRWLSFREREGLFFRTMPGYPRDSSFAGPKWRDVMAPVEELFGQRRLMCVALEEMEVFTAP